MKSKLFAILAVAVSLSCFPISNAHAQNAGNTGTQTIAQAVTYTADISPIFRNVGQSAHFLAYCLAAFQGSIDLEVSFDGTTNWMPIALASYPTVSGGCNILQAGGYYQNIRSVRTVGAGSFTAFYSASSGPISYAATGISNVGPTPPTVCNAQNSGILVANATTSSFIPSGTNAATRLYICSFALSFNGATAAGSVKLQMSTNSCAGTFDKWTIITTANTPQLIQFAFNSAIVGGQGDNAFCLTNNSGASVEWAFNYTFY
jgi:hypothetical protein